MATGLSFIHKNNHMMENITGKANRVTDGRDASWII
jgi:hypothetical protein